MTAISSTCWAMFGSQSETHSPLWPYCLKARRRGEKPVARLGALRGEQRSRDGTTAARAGSASLIEQRLGIEQIDLAGAAFHEAPDDVLGPRRNVRLLGRKRIYPSGVAILRQHGGQRDPGQTTAGLREELAAAGNVPVMLQLIEYWSAMASSSIDVQKLVGIEQHLRQVDERGGARRIHPRGHIRWAEAAWFYRRRQGAAAMIGICFARNSAAIFSSSAVAARP